jgi:beta-1,4-mannosyl-glycoprotein beta-1,4-N-acetylglucosaminyltransferase
MAKIFDCFLYNGEDELLDIRLNYLNNYIDYFLIVESCQTFQGKKKYFRFKDNIEVIKKFKKKIIYFQNNIFGDNINDLRKQLIRKYPYILKALNKLKYFSKNDLTWYLDAFHREIIIEPLKKKVKNNDIVILSDIDEIPSYEIFANRLYDSKKVNVLIQKEFRYFYNTIYSNNWHKTIVSSWQQIKQYGLNNLRYLANKKNKNFNYIINGGYHFSSMGPKNNILRKINEWSHSEFNNNLIKFFMKHRYKKGLDIFFISKNQLRILDLTKNNYDLKITNLLKKKFLLKKGSFNPKNIYDDIIFYFVKALLVIYKFKRKFNI